MSIGSNSLNQNSPNFFINRNSFVGNNNTSAFVPSNGLVSGDELRQVVSEILSNSSVQQTAQSKNSLTNVNNSGANLTAFGVNNSNSLAAQQIANNLAVSLSPQAISSIDSLKVQANQALAANSVKINEAVSQSQTSDIQSALAPKKTFESSVSKIGNDKKGSNSYSFNNAKTNNSEGSDQPINFFV